MNYMNDFVTKYSTRLGTGPKNQQAGPSTWLNTSPAAPAPIKVMD